MRLPKYMHVHTILTFVDDTLMNRPLGIITLSSVSAQHFLDFLSIVSAKLVTVYTVLSDPEQGNLHPQQPSGGDP